MANFPKTFIFVPIAVAWAVALATGATASAKIEFNRDVRPILSNNCFACHGPDQHKRKAKLRLDKREGAVADRDGSFAINPDNLAESELLQRILSGDPDEVMPPPDSHHKLTEAEKKTLASWVAGGGAYQDHWSFIPPKKPAVPDKPGSSGNAIDAFILQRLREANLTPLPQDSKETIIRRTTFDLTGLPPTPAEVDAFLNDASPDAYEKLVDRLLDSPHFGERMTLDWMDAARYGDTSVMHADGPRDMWPWRDWVINAYNSNMPFDQFTVEQIAGDLLPDATTSQKVASGFNRNHASSDEGGAIPEELRVSYVVDRVKTTSTVWLALSLECAQCHDHKYDPISQKEYYQFFAYFNNTTDPGMQTRNGNQSPVVAVVSANVQKTIDQTSARLAEAKAKLEAHKQEAAPAFDQWLAEAQKNASARKPEPTGLVHHFPLTERSGKHITETIGKQNGKLSGKFQPAKHDKLDRGHKFNGKNSFAFDQHPPRERDQPFSFSAWLKLPQNSGGSVLARMDVGKAYRGYDFWVQSRSVGTHLINAWPANALKVVSSEALKPNTWQHVCITYDGSSKPAGVKIYIDGKLTANVVEQNSLSETIATDTPFRVGSRSQGGNFSGEADDLRIYDHVLNPDEIASLGGDPIAGILATAPDKRSPEQQAQLLNHFLSSFDKTYQSISAEIGKLAAVENELRAKNKVTSMIMQDNAKPRMTYVLDRGQYDAPIKAEVIPSGVPSALGELPETAPPNRLGLARWLTRPDHPLTSRVAVNRLWTMFFGTGLVKTSGDFGNQGEWPSHPQLLDWLAVDFVEHGWDIKRTVKQIVTSDAYRRSSRSTAELLRADPENRLLARGPRFRLHAEFIRDNALAVSGLLVPNIGGPGVKPYQPANIWNEVSLNGGLRYKQDHGDNLYRRAMYTYWKRSAPLPSMLIFDVPTREMCSVERPRTNTPLQALVTLNDPQFVEAARALAQRLIKQGGDTAESRIDLAFRLATARHANAREIAVLKKTLTDQTAVFTADPAKADAYLKVGESKRDDSINPIEHAAWTIIAQMILNLDEFVTRG